MTKIQLSSFHQIHLSIHSSILSFIYQAIDILCHPTVHHTIIQISYLFIYLCIHPSIYLSTLVIPNIHQSFHISFLHPLCTKSCIQLFIHSSTHQPFYASIHAIHLSICPPIHSSFCQHTFVHLSIHSPSHPSIHHCISIHSSMHPFINSSFSPFIQPTILYSSTHQHTQPICPLIFLSVHCHVP